MWYLFLTVAIGIVQFIEVTSAVICPAAFFNIQGICILINKTPSTYCQAWDYCFKIGGHLAYGNEIQIVNISGLLTYVDLYAYYVGVNDLANERYRNLTGWQFIDGSIMNDTSGWLTDEPGIVSSEPEHGLNGQDCVLMRNSKFHDLTCDLPGKSICIYGTNKNLVHEKLYDQTSSILFNNDGQFGCYDILKTRSRTECAVKSIQQPYYKSFYYDDRNKTCVLVKYVDSTLSKIWNVATSNWRRFY